MLRHVDVFGDFADRPERVWAFVHHTARAFSSEVDPAHVKKMRLRLWDGLLVLLGHVASIDARLEHVRGLEHHDAAGLDRHLDAGLGIAADAFPLLTYDERAKG